MYENFKELISKEELDRRIEELAKEIDEDYLNKELTIICVMRGAVFFAVELTLKMKTKLKYEFITISSYEGTDSTGEVTLRSDLREPIEGKDVLIVEDIVDTGKSMKYLLEHLWAKNPRTLKVCALINRKGRREIEVPIDYVGFDAPNNYVVGFGFDIDNNYRNLPYVAYLEG